MKIHKGFTGGNIRVYRQEGSTVYLGNELRDTMEDWFYWAFCVEGAQGQELTFCFEKDRLGYYGPAVSHDLKEWHWLDEIDGDSFTYQFKENESKVYFAHHMLYHPDRFMKFAKERNLDISTLCQSPKGHNVPYIQFGNGEKTILLTARHHSCESTGNYVMEGILDRLLCEPLENVNVFCVPFVDYDGVIYGDQGKFREPHDHNRDYTKNPIYPEVAAIMNFVENNGCHFAFDLHAPWHKGGENDHIYIVRNNSEKEERFRRFSEILKTMISKDSMIYDPVNDLPHRTSWNQPSANMGYILNRRPECELAFIMENTYFGLADNKVSQEKLVELGRCFAEALRKYMQE